MINVYRCMLVVYEMMMMLVGVVCEDGGMDGCKGRVVVCMIMQSWAKKELQASRQPRHFVVEGYKQVHRFGHRHP